MNSHYCEQGRHVDCKGLVTTECWQTSMLCACPCHETGKQSPPVCRNAREELDKSYKEKAKRR